MKFGFSTEHRLLIQSILISLAHTKGVNRHSRRNIMRLANKFTENSTQIDLAPKDRRLVCGLMISGFSILEKDFAKLDPMTDVGARTNIQTKMVNMSEILEKLGDGIITKAKEEVTPNAVSPTDAREPQDATSSGS